MRGHIEQYLRQAQHNNNQHVMSADGYLGADGFKDDLFFTDDMNQENFYRQADGGAAPGVSGQDMPTALPIILQISNASAAVVSNFNIFNATNLIGQSSLFSNGNYTASGVTVSSALPTANVTYQNILGNLLSSPMTIGGTYLSSLAGAANQVNQAIGVNTYSNTGNSAGKILTFPLSPQQFQTTAFINRTPYRIDGQTYMTLTILASVVFQIWLYPSYDISLARGLNQSGNVGREYNAPKIAQPTIAIMK